MGFSTTKNQTHIDSQYDKVIEIIKQTFGETSERTVSLIKLYEDFEDQIKWAPASGKLNFHNAHEGGYLDHILNVLKCAKYMKLLYEKMGGDIDFTDEELVMVALHHDLGKIGLLDEPYYIVQDSEWHRKNRLEVFKHNEDTQYMTISDRSMYLLQTYGVTLTRNEYLSIRLTDGLYDEANKKYLIQYGAGPYPMKTNLHKIMHWADHMAASVENDEARKG